MKSTQKKVLSRFIYFFSVDFKENSLLWTVGTQDRMLLCNTARRNWFAWITHWKWWFFFFGKEVHQQFCCIIMYFLVLQCNNLEVGMGNSSTCYLFFRHLSLSGHHVFQFMSPSLSTQQFQWFQHIENLLKTESEQELFF